MSNGFGLFAGALSRAVTEALGGAVEGELEAPRLTRAIRRGQMEEQLFPYQLGAAQTEAADLPGRIEHERWRREQERRETGRPKVHISGEYAARVTPEGTVAWERRPQSPLEQQLETYQTEELKRLAQLPAQLRSALQAAEQKKGSPLTLDEQLQIGTGLAPDFKTRTDYLKMLTALDVARERRHVAETRAQQETARLGAWTRYWQARERMLQQKPAFRPGRSYELSRPAERDFVQSQIDRLWTALVEQQPDYRQYVTGGWLKGAPPMPSHVQARGGAELATRLQQETGIEVQLRWNPTKRKFEPLTARRRPEPRDAPAEPEPEASEPETGEPPLTGEGFFQGVDLSGILQDLLRPPAGPE